MNALERAGFLAHAETATFERKVEQTENIVRRWLDICLSPYVAFSGGKDSTVALDLVRRQRADVDAVSFHPEWMLPETEMFICETLNVRWVADKTEHAGGWFVSWEGGPEGLPENVEWLPDGGGARMLAEKHGYDGAAIGIRADENKTRKLHIRKFGTCFFAENNGVWQCYPVAYWTDKDIFAYILSRDAPYNPAYDTMSEMGIPLREWRIGPFGVEGPARRGALAMLEQGWPDLFERFAERFPEARRYV